MAAIALFEFFKRKEDSPRDSLLMKKEAERADRAVAKVLEAASKRGKIQLLHIRAKGCYRKICL